MFLRCSLFAVVGWCWLLWVVVSLGLCAVRSLLLVACCWCNSLGVLMSVVGCCSWCVLLFAVCCVSCVSLCVVCCVLLIFVVLLHVECCLLHVLM